MQHDIAFLHTSPAHVPTFEKLMQQAAPALRVAHVVREDLLSEARRDGTESAPLVARIHQAMAEAGATGAPVVVCTCSTIGGVAEAMDTNGSFNATRVDRAMADEAVKTGRPVLLVAALESTLRPTTDLLRTSAERLGVTTRIESLLVHDAWPHFLAGDHTRYINVIVEAVSRANCSSSVVVLAQASMAPAADALAKWGITALSSPKFGVEHVVALHAKSHAVGCPSSN
jgi:hypothetical protein